VDIIWKPLLLSQFLICFMQEISPIPHFALNVCTRTCQCRDL